MKATAGVTLGVALALGLTACGADLQGDDPEGYKACNQYDRYTSDGSKFEFLESGAVGDQARKASTKSIRKAAKPMVDGASMDTLNEQGSGGLEQIFLVNAKKLRAACEDAGYEF